MMDSEKAWWCFWGAILVLTWGPAGGPPGAEADEDWGRRASEDHFWQELRERHGDEVGGVTLLHEAHTEMEVRGTEYYLVTSVHLVQAVFDAAAPGVADSWELPVTKERQLKDVSGRTYHRDGSVRKLRGDDVTDRTPYGVFSLYRDVQVKTFSLPEVRPESVIEIKYKWVEGGGAGSSSWRGLGSFDTPAAEGGGVTGGPYLLYRHAFEGELPTEISRYVVSFPPELAARGLGQQYVSFGAVPAPQSESFFSPDGERMRVYWEVTGRKGVIHETFMPPWWDVVSYVALSPSGMSWPELGVFYYQEHVAHPLTEDRGVAARAGELVASAGGAREKAESIFRFLQQEVDFVPIPLGDGGYVPSPPREVMEAGHGDARDQAVLLAAMLRAVGLEAHPVAVRTRDRGHLDEALVTLGQFDHMICSVHLPAGDVWCDATDPFTEFGSLPLGIQGVKGLVLRDEGAGLVTLPKARGDQGRLTRVVRGRISPGGEVEGNLEITAEGLGAVRERHRWAVDAQGSQELWARSLLAAEELRVGGVQIGGELESAGPLSAVIEMNGAGLSTVSGNTMDVIPLWTRLRGLPSSPGEGARRHAFTSSLALTEADSLLIELPSGYHWPEGERKRRLASPLGRFTLSVTQEGEALRVVRTLRVRAGEWGLEHYARIQQFVEGVRRESREPVVLRREG